MHSKPIKQKLANDENDVNERNLANSSYPSSRNCSARPATRTFIVARTWPLASAYLSREFKCGSRIDAPRFARTKSSISNITAQQTRPWWQLPLRKVITTLFRPMVTSMAIRIPTTKSATTRILATTITTMKMRECTDKIEFDFIVVLFIVVWFFLCL